MKLLVFTIVILLSLNLITLSAEDYFSDDKNPTYYAAIKDEPILSKLNKNIKENPNSSFHLFQRGKYYYDQNDYYRALIDFNKVLKINPKSLPAYFMRALIMLERNNYRVALSDLNLVLSYDSLFPTAYIYRGVINEKLGDKKGAIKDYTTAINQSKFIRDNENIFLKKEVIHKWLYKMQGSNSAYSFRAKLKTDLKDYHGAIKDYDILINKTKDLPLVINKTDLDDKYYNRAMLKFKIGDQKSGCDDLSKAGELGKIEVYELINKYCN